MARTPGKKQIVFVVVVVVSAVSSDPCSGGRWMGYGVGDDGIDDEGDNGDGNHPQGDSFKPNFVLHVCNGKEYIQ